MIAQKGVMESEPAVMPTGTARIPFEAIERTGYLGNNHNVISETIAPPAAASAVVTNTSDTR